LESFAEEKIKQGYHNVIMGHVHKAAQRTFAGEGYIGTYTNTGTWLTTPTFAEFNGTHVCLRTLEEFLREF
jgi:UDP-2,3-diacylglucosamine pyrophosphatase LpxH